ncbi:MAG: Isoquinoline 1-oxidoreductase subunit [Pseudomonadota bacterium]
MRKAQFVAKSIFVLAILGMAAACSPQSNAPTEPPASRGDAELRPLSDFDAFTDNESRADALFDEIGRVIQHPRCVNCHPRTDRPLQGEEGALHQPMVVRGAGGMGQPGMFCTTCHGAENYRNVPGNPAWRLAPAEMAWEGKSLSEICLQIKDEERNGGLSLMELGEHMAEDELVAYGWNPPAHLDRAPGDQESFGALFHAWIDAGAHCPSG